MIIYGLYSDRANKKIFVHAESNLAMMKRLKADEQQPDVLDCNGEKKAVNWQPPEIKWFDDDGRNVSKYKDPDISYIGVSSRLLMSPSAAKLFQPVIEDVAELLPVPVNDETWSFLNVFNRVDAFDETNSDYEIYESGERGWLNKPAFFTDKLPHAKLFMIKEDPTTIYYAEHYPDDNPNTFKNVLEKNKLFGIKLEEYTGILK